jgi:hypothetical protein
MNEDQKFWIFFLAILGFIVFLAIAVYIIIAFPPPYHYHYNPIPFQLLSKYQ